MKKCLEFSKHFSFRILGYPFQFVRTGYVPINIGFVKGAVVFSDELTVGEKEKRAYPKIGSPRFDWESNLLIYISFISKFIFLSFFISFFER